MAQGKKKKNVKKSPQKSALKKALPKKTMPKKAASKKATPKKVAAQKAVSKKTPFNKAAPQKSAMKPVAKALLSVVKKIDLTKFLTPLDDRLIVQLTERAKKTAGGLFIPDTVASVSGNLEGHVIATGRGHRDKKGRIRPLDVTVGDRILFPQYAGSKIDIQGADVVILRESDVMGLFQK